MSSSEQPTHRSGGSGGSVKGILKKESPGPEGHSSRHLKWDEEKLAEAEANKSATMKITEPKTPYAHGVADISDDDADGGGADDTKRMPGLQLNSDSEHSSVQFASSGAEWESSEEFDGAHLTDEERARRHAKFQLMRKEHYRMKDALKKGRQLAESEL